MALTPLSFSIGVKDEASSQLEKINAELNNLVSKLDSIKNIAISLGGDPKEAESLMQSLNGVASSLANITKLSPEAQAASDRLTASQQKLNEATEMYNGLLAKIKASNPTQAFQDITKGLTGLSANGFAGGFKKLDPTEWAGFFRKFLVQSTDLSAKDVEGNVNQIVANIRRALSESLSNGKPFASILEEGFKFDSVNQKLNEAFAKLREAYIKGIQELKEVETNKNGLNAVSSVIPGLQQQVEAAKKELDTLKNAASTTPVNPESFKGAEGAIAATNEATKMLGEALNKLDFSKINTGLDQLAEKLKTLITELEGIEGRMKTAFTGALEANVKSLGDVIDGLAKKMAAVSAPMSEGMKQGEQATNAQTEAIKKQEEELLSIQKKLQRLQEIRKEAVGTISELRSSYGSKPNTDWWRTNSIHDAIAKDREESKSAVDAIEKRWEAYWRKQEQEAQKFANSLNKALKDVKWDDFEKHSSGALSDQAKSWYRVQMRELYDVQRMKEEVHRLKGYGDDQYREEIRVLEALIRKISQYENAKNKAFSASPNQDAAVAKVSADERAYYVAWGRLSAANNERRKLLEQEADAQQRLNGLRSGAIDSSAAKYEEQRLAITKQIEEAEKNIALAKERISKADAQLARLNSGQMSAKEAAAFVGQHAFEPGNYGTFIESEQKRITALKQQLAELDEQKRQSAMTAEKQVQTEQQQAQATKELGQASQQTAEQLQKLAQSTVGEAFNQLAASLTKIKELFDNLGKAEGLTQLNNTINGVNTAVEALAKTLSNVNNAVKFTGSTEEIAAYEAKVKSLQEQVAALEAKAKGLGETAKAASEQVKTVTASGGGGGSSKDGLTEAQLKRVNDQLEILQKRLNTIEPNYTKAKELGFSDEVIQGKINHLHAYIDALNEAVKAGSYSGIKVGEYSLFSRAANEDVPTQAQAQKMAKQMQEYIAIQQQAQAEAERQAQAQERMRQAAEAAGMSIVKAGDQTQSAGQQSETAKQQMHGFNEEILVNMRSWEQAGKQMAIFEKRIFAVMAQLQSGKALGFDTGSLQTDIQELMRFYAIMREIRNNYGFAEIEGAMLTTSKVLKESGLDFGKMWEKNKQELNAVKTIYEQMTRLQALANNKNALPTDNLNTKYQREALENALRAQDIMAKLKSVDLRQATALVGGQDYQQATAAIEAFFRTYNKNANIATSQTAELQRLLEKIQGTDKGGGWINVMKNAGVSEDKINEMRQIAEKIQRAIAALEQSRQMGTAANFVQSDWYRATVVEGKKANDTGYLAVREAHERAAAEREASKATQESAKAAEKKREEMSKAWREQEAARQKEAAAAEASLQRQMAAEEKARQKSIDDAWKAADQKIRADQHAAQERERANQKATKEEIRGYEEQEKKLVLLERAMAKRFAAEQEAARKAQQEKDKLYGAAGLRENDPGLQNMTAQLDALMQRISQVRELIGTIKSLLSNGIIGEESALRVIKDYENELGTLMRQYEALSKARSALSAQVPFAETQRSVKNVELEQLNEAYRQEAKAADEAAKAKKKDAENSRAAGKEISDLKVKIDTYTQSKTFQKAQKLNIDTSDYERAIDRLKRYQAILEYIKSDAGSHHKPSLVAGIGASAINDLRMQEAALKRLISTQQETASATNQLTAEEQRLAQALNQTTEHARGQSQVLSDLKMMATQYLGVWGGQQFLRNIIEIGGQLEMQRMSIGAILQNQSQANDLFEKIKGLATQSPFGVVELDQMTKQLTAYGFKYNELYDMTKRLADISAATGTGVDRLALALGHVRSEAALSGYTLRQFSMGNVPLLQKLSEKLGKTTQEIRKMVRSKEISYEDVESVIKDLTNEGGMFYNMQEVISQSVKARFKNVKDAMAIMYGEMAEGGIGEALKDVADALMELTKNWKDVATVVGTGAVAWGIQRAAVILSTKALGANSAAVLSNINSHIRKEGILLSEAAAYRTLSASETQTLLASRAYNAQTLLRIALGKKLTVEQLRQIVSQKQMRVNALALAISTKKLTVEELSHMVAMGKVSKETAIAAIRQAGLKKSVEGASIAMIEQTRVLTFGQKAAMAASTAIKTLGAAFKSFAPMLLITGLMEAFQRVTQMKERAEDLGRDIMQTSQDALQSTRKMMGDTGIRAEQKSSNGKTIDVTNIFGTELEPEKTVLIKPEFDYETAQSTIDAWSQFIREYSATPNKMLNNALLDDNDNVRSLQEQYDRLFDSMQEVIRAQEILSNTNYPLIFEASQSNTSDGWWDDDVVDDASDYVKARKELMQQVTKLSRAYPSETKKVIDAARREDAAFAAATKGMSSYNDMLIKLIENKDEFSKAGEILEDVLYTPHTDSERATAYLYATKAATQQAVKQAELDNEIDGYIASIKTAFSGVDISPAIQQALLKSFKMALEKMNLPKDTLNKYLKQFADAIGAEMDDAQEKQIKRLADWQKRAGKVFEVNTEIKVKTKTITSIDEFAQAVQKDLKEKQEYIDRNASHIRHTLTINAGIKFNMDKLDTKALNDMIIELGTKVQVLLQQGKIEAAKSLNSVIQDELIPFRDVLASIDENKKWLKSEGYPEKDPTKDKSKNKSGSKKSYEDPIAKEWKERIRLLKDANSLYKEWNKRVGEDEALNKVRQQYGDIFKKWRTDKNVPWTDFKAEDIIEYRSYIQKIVDEAQKRYDAQRNNKAKNYGKEAEAVLREGKKLLDDIDKYDFDEKVKDFTAAATKAIERLNRRWEVFKSAVDTTGDALLAAQLAGFGDAEQGARTAADAIRNELMQRLSEFGNADFVAKIPLDIDLNEEEVRDKFLDAIPSVDTTAVEKYKESISALIKLYQEWQKLQQKANTDDINTYTKIIGLANSYDAQIKKINKDLQEQLASISANPLLSESQKSKGSRMAEASADWKKMKLSADYANLHNRAVAMSAEEYERAEIAIRNMIERLRTLGLLSPEEDISETNALNKAAKERRQDTNGALGHFITGGQQGLRDYYQRLADAALENRSRYTASSAEWKKADAEYKKNKEKAEAIDDEIAGIQATQAALENLQKAASLLSDFFTAIAGESGDGAALGSISGGAMSGASALSGFGPWGMAAGAILGGATAMIQEGDKAAERAIQDLRGDVRAIEANTEEILKLRERSLGYDSGKYLADLYKNQAALVSEYFANPFDSKEAEKSFHASWGASIMRDWYKELYGGASSGYEAQYNNLIEQRKNYLAILDEQNENKHKSDEEIAETKSKIAELDDQIMHFSQDLAKELWGIDIKGWADQLSDALASAFENGENMAKAYRDTVTSIIQQMMQKMMQMSILEPMFERLQKQLFGENGNGGVFDPNNPKGSMSKVTKVIGDYFGKGGEGEKAITASMEFMTAFQRGMQNAGLTVLNEASNTLSSGIQGTSEETSDLLAGYVNALRQDVSVNRILLTQYVTQLWPQYIEAYTAQVTSVSSIDNNVRVIMEMMQLGNGAMYERISNISSRIDNIVMGIDSISIR